MNDKGPLMSEETIEAINCWAQLAQIDTVAAFITLVTTGDPSGPQRKAFLKALQLADRDYLASEEGSYERY